MKKQGLFIACIAPTLTLAMTPKQSACELRAKTLETQLFEQVKKMDFTGKTDHIKAVRTLQKAFPQNKYLKNLEDYDANSIIGDLFHLIAANEGKISDKKYPDHPARKVVEEYFDKSSLGQKSDEDAKELIALAKEMYLHNLKSWAPQNQDELEAAFIEPYGADQFGMYGVRKIAYKDLPKEWKAIIPESKDIQVGVGVMTNESMDPSSIEIYKASLEDKNNPNKTYSNLSGLVLDQTADCKDEFYHRKGVDAVNGNPVSVVVPKLQRDPKDMQSSSRTEKTVETTPAPKPKLSPKLNLGGAKSGGSTINR